MLNAIASDTIKSTVSYGSDRDGQAPQGSQWPGIRLHSTFGTAGDAPGMLSKLIDSIVVVAHGEAAPTQSEWDAMYQLIEGGSSVRGLIVAIHPKCPGPNAFQRRQCLPAWERRRNGRLAVITTSALHRGIITGFSWFLGDQVRAFSPAQWRNAMGHVGIGVETQFRILDWWHDAIRVLGEPREYEAVGIDPRRWRAELPPPDSIRADDGSHGQDGSLTGGELLLGPSTKAAPAQDNGAGSSLRCPDLSRIDSSEQVAASRVPTDRSPKSMATSMLGRDDLLLLVHAATAPTQDEWKEHVAYMASLFERRQHRGIYCLVYSLGGAPNAEQRQEVVDITPPGKRGKLAVLTQSSLMHEAPEAHSWVRGATVQVFGPGEDERALAWLGIKFISLATVQDEIDRLLKGMTGVARSP